VFDAAHLIEACLCQVGVRGRAGTRFDGWA
jgi:hypothetical protein